MSDTEWDRWQANWTGAQGPLPEVRARARREARVQRLAGAGYFALIAVALAAIGFTDFSEPVVRDILWANLAFLSAMAIGYLLIRRAGGPSGAGNPRDALALLETRLRFERRTAQLVRWVHAALFAVGLVLFPRLTATHQSPRLELSIILVFMSLLLAVTFSAPWWVARRSRRHQEELDRWRRWMDEQQL